MDIDKSPLDALFDHPCKQTCSGWQQGFDKGALLERKKILELLRDHVAIPYQGFTRPAAQLVADWLEKELNK